MAKIGKNVNIKIRKIAVTGGLSCGKSSVCRIFKELGAYVVSADEVVHQLLSPTTNLGRQVISLLGADIIVDKQIDRSKIAKKVFKEPTLLQSLENLLHPAVRDEIEKQYRQIAQQPSPPLFVVEIPLLFETGADRFYDATIAVIADPEDSQQRFEKSTGYDKEEYKRRMARQLSQEEKASRATYVIENKGSLADLHEAVTKLLCTIHP